MARASAPDLRSQSRDNRTAVLILGTLPDAAMIVVGFSRGATMVAFTAVSRSLRQGLAGGIAVALTGETDYLRAPDPADRLPEIEVSSTFPATVAAGLRLAIRDGRSLESGSTRRK